MIYTSDNGYLIGGYGTPVAGGNINCISQSWSKPEAIVLKLDANRNIEWQQCLDGTEHDGINELIEVPGGYLMGMWSTSNDGDFANSGYHIGYDQYGNTTYDIVLRRIDYNGNKVWQRCYGGSNDEYPLKIFNLSDGNIMIFGQAASKDGDVVGLHYDPGYAQYTYRDIWMFKINSSTGDIIWYAIEALAREDNMTHQQRHELRLEKSLPIINEIGSYIYNERSKVLPKSPIGVAFEYCANRWISLQNYLKDGMLEIDSNLIENSIRPLALGRKNYLFAGNHDAAENIAMLYSFFGTCKKNDIDPQKWITYVINNINDTKATQLNELLPQFIDKNLLA